MKIYTVSLIKNEADIIEKNLTEAAKWSDKIYVFDNGSTDGTWELVNKIKSDKIIPLKTSDVPFRDELRKEVFDFFRHELDDGDWVCVRLDADEFYIDDPKIFLSSLKPNISLVYGINIEFQFTEDNLNDKDEIFSFDKFQYFCIPSYEQRFVKYRKKLQWLPKGSIPSHPGVAARKFIKYAHYQFRNQEQIKKRLKTRKEALDTGLDMYWEEDLGKTWESKIKNKDKLIKMTVDADLDKIVKESKISIPENYFQRLIKHIMHGFSIWP
jgi:hypothetical protein